MEPKAYSYIRFSSPEQEKGDSLRRQTELSEKYALSHGLTLDTALKLTDRGLSAFSGAHRAKGALGEFLRLVESGQIPQGSVLLVESLDRLSREDVLAAHTQFLSIIGSGIRLVTLADNRTYDRESINDNYSALIMSLTLMSKAHEESLLKSQRLTAAWQSKRKNGQDKKLTARAPAWLKLVNNEFRVIPEAAQVIQQIFDMKLAGIGKSKTVNILNSSDVWKPKAGANKKAEWRESYLHKILQSRTTLGEFQPRSKRQPIGDPIIDYFPAIVSKDKFDRVQEMFRHNLEISGNAGGRNGKISNLFGHIVVCSFCGGPMAYVNKGMKPKGGQYLVCDRARRGLDCEREYLRYDQFEPLILQFCKGLDATEILPGQAERQSELSTLSKQLQAINGDLIQLEQKINNVLDSIANTDSAELRKALQDRADKMLTDKANLEERQKEVQARIDTLANAGHDTEQRLKTIQELFDHMEQAEDQERISARTSLREQLRRLIKRIKVDPIKGSFVIFFNTGERRLLTLKDGLVFDAYPKGKEVKP